MSSIIFVTRHITNAPRIRGGNGAPPAHPLLSDELEKQIRSIRNVSVIKALLVKSNAHVYGRQISYTLEKTGEQLDVDLKTSPVCFKGSGRRGNLHGYCIVASGGSLSVPVLVAPSEEGPRVKQSRWSIWDANAGFDHGLGDIIRLVSDPDSGSRGTPQTSPQSSPEKRREACHPQPSFCEQYRS